MKYFSLEEDFWQGNSPEALIKEYGSPLYVYNERIISDRCQKMLHIAGEKMLKPSYSAKANTNPEIIKIVRKNGLNVDVMSPGEIMIALKAGYQPEEILYISNNVSDEEFKFAIEAGVMVSVDSLSQLDSFGALNHGGKVVIRFNPGVGAGHHAKVVTGGKTTKFGVNSDCVNEVLALLKKHELTLLGINQHIGSLFMDGASYIEAVENVLKLAEQLPIEKFIDFGGGFGIPYRKQEGQAPMDDTLFKEKLPQILSAWAEKHPGIIFKSEPGRYIVAEGGILLGTVNGRKQNGEKTFIGCDLGFNVLVRPAMYDSHHEIEVYRNGQPLNDAAETEVASVVGNICESGDILAKDRVLPVIEKGDILAVTDAGAYGFSMSSNYNSRLRPAEVLIEENGNVRIIRRRETLEDLMNTL